MNRDAIEQLIRRTRRKLFFARWLTATMSFYFYTFFVLTAFILTDRIGGELNLWVPFTLEWIIVSGVIGTVVGGALYGLAHAWWNRCSKREIAWMIDRRCGADALLVTALESDELQIDDSWASLMEEKAAELTTSFMSRNLFRIPGQGIRWLFLFALLIDLGLVLLLTPVQKIRTPAPSTGEQARASGGGGGKAKGKTGGGSEAKGGDTEQKNEPDASGEKENSKENSKDESRDNPEDSPMFGEKRRREHERDPQVQEEEPESGPTREGFVRAVNPGQKEQENGSGSDDENQDNADDTPDPSRAEALHRQYQRQAERMIWRRSLSEEERALVRRYFERIRPDSDASTATGDEDTPD
jgi:hypothetical protein